MDEIDRMPLKATSTDESVWETDSTAVCGIVSRRSSESLRITRLPDVSKAKERCFYKLQPWTGISRTFYIRKYWSLLSWDICFAKDKVFLNIGFAIRSHGVISSFVILSSASFSFLICYKGIIALLSLAWYGCWETLIKALRTVAACSEGGGWQGVLMGLIFPQGICRHCFC